MLKGCLITEEDGFNSLIFRYFFKNAYILWSITPESVKISDKYILTVLQMRKLATYGTVLILFNIQTSDLT